MPAVPLLDPLRQSSHLVLPVLVFVLPPPRAPRRDPEVGRNVVAFAHAAGGEPEPVGKDAATLVPRVVREQPMEPVLLLAPAALPAVHLPVFVRALLPMHVLFKGIEVEEGEDLAAGVIRPKRGYHLFFNWTSVSEIIIKNVFERLHSCSTTGRRTKH